MMNESGGSAMVSGLDRGFFGRVTRLLGVLLATLLLAAACSGVGNEGQATVDLEPTLAAEPALSPEPAPTVELDPTATAEPVPTVEPIPEAADTNAVRAVWESFLEGAVGPEGDEDHLALALENGTQEARDDVKDRFRGSVDRAIDKSYAKIEATDSGWVVSDCVTVTPGVGDPGWVTLVAQVADTTDGPMVKTVELPNRRVNCVPAEIATAVIAGYEAYLDAELAVFSSGGADEALVTATATGERLEAELALVETARIGGWELRGRPLSHPFVSGYRFTGEFILTDCQEVPLGYGVYDSSTGSRLDDLIPPIIEGQRDSNSILMRLEDSTWKVAELLGNANDGCNLEPDDSALPVL